MGSSPFGIPALEMLMREGYQLAGIVSTPPAPRGRGLQLFPSAVAEYCRSRQLGPILCPARLQEPEFIAELRGWNADFFIVVAFRLLPSEVFKLPPRGTINIHASLLPRYRGPAPIQRAIEAGERTTGVSIFFIDDGVDTGRILRQKATPIGPRETTPQLSDRLSLLGADVLRDALYDHLNGNAMPIYQDENLARHAPKLKKEEAHIDWRMPAPVLFNRIRAFKPFPGTFTVLKGKRLGIVWAEPGDQSAVGEPGRVCAVGDGWFEVGCGSGRLRVLEVKPEAKKEMPAAAFMRGTAIHEGTQFE
jgi:methionyl-tRNA formyltransferase